MSQPRSIEALPLRGITVFLCADAVHPRFYFSEVFPIANAVHQINEEINDKEVRLIGDQGEQLGIMSAAEALRIAEEKELDLVKIAPGSNPPVCKIMDYGKFRFEQTKKDTKRCRRLRSETYADETNAATIKKMIPYK